jgi:hypothetical protein
MASHDHPGSIANTAPRHRRGRARRAQSPRARALGRSGGVLAARVALASWRCDLHWNLKCRVGVVPSKVEDTLTWMARHRWRCGSGFDGGALVVLVGESMVLEHRGGKVSEEGLKKKGGKSQRLELTMRQHWRRWQPRSWWRWRRSGDPSAALGGFYSKRWRRGWSRARFLGQKSFRDGAHQKGGSCGGGWQEDLGKRKEP